MRAAVLARSAPGGGRLSMTPRGPLCGPALPPFEERDKEECLMPIRLDARSADFAARFRAFLDAKREASADVEQAVRAIIADVAARGDAALLELTQKFDRVDLAAIGMRVTAAELDAAAAACDPEALVALTL